MKPRTILKNRKQKISIFICCEGKTELAFLKYVKNLYISGDQKSIRINSINGGNICKMKKYIKTKKKHIHIDKYYILSDGDQIGSQNINDEKVLIASPCIEKLFLEILDQSKLKTTKECKKIFETKYLNRKDKLSSQSYQKIFNKDKLEDARRKIPLLNRVLKIFEAEK